MWFLYMIINLYLFTTFFRKIIANSSRNELHVIVIFTFLIAMKNAFCIKVFYEESKLFLNWFLSYIPYFFAGYLIRTDNRNYPKVLLWSVFLFSVWLTAIRSYIEATNKDLHKDFYFYDYLSITVIPMSLSVMYLLKSWKTPVVSEIFSKTLSALTLGIYLIHPIFLEAIEYAGFGPLSLYPLVSIPIIAIVAFSSSLGGAWVIYRLPYLKRVI